MGEGLGTAHDTCKCLLEVNREGWAWSDAREERLSRADKKQESR